MLLIGLMSGTSADGIDAVLIETGTRPLGPVALLGHVHIRWSQALQRHVTSLCRADAPLQEIVALSFRLGEDLAEAALAVARESGIPLSEIHAIGSHGQTIWHQPTPLRVLDRDVTGTLQLGEPSVIAARTGCVVVADFRPADMAVGGQGAPLVPFADFALLRSRQESRMVVNLGGIANVTVLPRNCARDEVLAFDVGPANMLMDALARKSTNGGQQFDTDGAMAARGTVNVGQLTEFLAHPFFAASPPKSTGREVFGDSFADRFYSAARRRHCSAEDMLATAASLTAEALRRAYNNWVEPETRIDRVILGGGGVHNTTLVEQIGRALGRIKISTHADFGLPDDAKEAVAFALLARETLAGRPSNIPGATGAREPAVLGKIVLPAGGVAKVAMRAQRSA